MELIRDNKSDFIIKYFQLAYILRIVVNKIDYIFIGRKIKIYKPVNNTF